MSKKISAHVAQRYLQAGRYLWFKDIADIPEIQSEIEEKIRDAIRRRRDDIATLSNEVDALRQRETDLEYLSQVGIVNADAVKALEEVFEAIQDGSPDEVINKKVDKATEEIRYSLHFGSTKTAKNWTPEQRVLVADSKLEEAQQHLYFLLREAPWAERTTKKAYDAVEIAAQIVGRELAREMSLPPSRTANTKEAGYTYGMDDTWFSFVEIRQTPFNIDNIREINRTFVGITSDEGFETSARLNVINTEYSGPLTFLEEKQGLRRETLVHLEFPEGYLEDTKRAMASLGKKWGFKVTWLRRYRKPETQGR